MAVLSCKQARQIDLVDFLATLGFSPAHIRGANYWYISPFRSERTPSFKVYRPKNVWYDHGEGRGGDLITFGTLFFQCNVSQFLQILQRNPANSSALMPNPKESIGLPQPESKIEILSTGPLTDPRLFGYLARRSIPKGLASAFIQQATFLLYHKEYIALAFQNDRGGYELRNPYFKGSSNPKDITTLKAGSEKLVVLEGFIDFLSYLVEFPDGKNNSYMILNSVSLKGRTLPLLAAYTAIELWVDNDKAGDSVVNLVCSNSSNAVDMRQRFAPFKDLNDHLCSLTPKSIRMRKNPPGLHP